MKKIITTIAMLALGISSTQAQITSWVNSFANSGINSGTDVEFDENGQVTVVGDFSGTVNFNPKGTANNITSAGGKDIFIAKYDYASGALLWVKTIGGTADDEATALDIDGANNLVVAGVFSSANVDFDPGAGSTPLSTSGSTDLFVLKLTTAGAFVWAQRAGGTQAELMTDVVIGDADNIYLAGSFQTLMDFFSNTNTATNGARDAFLCKLNSAGTFQWVKVIGGVGTDVSNKLNTIGTAILMCADIGSGSTTFNYGDGVTNGTFSGTGTNGIFIMFTSAGALNNKGQLTGNTRAIKLVSNGSLNIVVGTFSGTADIDPTATVQTVTSVGTTDMFFANLTSPNTTGTFHDYYVANGISATHQVVPTNAVIKLGANSAVADLYVTGYAKGSANFDGVSGSEITGPAVNDFSFVSKTHLQFSTTVSDFTHNFVYANANSTNNGNASRGLGVAISAGGGGLLGTGFYYSTTAAATTFNPGGTITYTSPSSNNAGFLQFINNCTNPTLTGTGASRCGTGTVALTATPSAGTVSWYTTTTGGSALGTGTSFTTPSITATTTYYAEASNGGCLSTPRTAILATVNPLPASPSQVQASRCGPGAVTLTVTTANGTTVNWYDASSGGNLLGTGTSFTTPNLTSNTTYYAQAVNGTTNCTSSRIAEMAVITPLPTVTGTGASRCGTGTVVLSATPSAGTVSWYSASSGGSLLGQGTNLTIPSITATTTYYVSTTNGGCTSSPRTAVTATVNPIPSVVVTANGSTLTVAETAATYQWAICSSKNSYTTIVLGGTNQSYSAPQSGSYAVFVTKSGCSDTSACANVVVTDANDQTISKELLKIYPNPNNGEFIIETEVGSEIEIMDQLGRLVKIIRADSSKNIHIEDLSEGIYMVKTKVDGKATLGKVVVTK